MNVWYESVTVTYVFEFQLSYLAVESVDSGKPLWGTTALSLFLVKAAVLHLSLFMQSFSNHRRPLTFLLTTSTNSLSIPVSLFGLIRRFFFTFLGPQFLGSCP
jgi:hypothetical protein